MLSFIMIIAFSVGSYQKGKVDQLQQDKVVIDLLMEANKNAERCIRCKK